MLSFCRQAWEPVLAKARRAVVFLDAACAESLHWGGGGAARLLAAGALRVKELSSFEAGGPGQPKALFVVSGLLRGRTADTIHDVLSLSSFQYCVVFTAASPAAHLLAQRGGAEHDTGGAAAAFELFEEKMCQWMGNLGYTAEVLHVPLLLAPVSAHLFVMPAFSSLFPLMPEDLPCLNSSRPEKRKLSNLSDLDFALLPTELQLQIRMLVSGLNALFEFLDVREESFAIGTLSKVIAGDLANYALAKNRRKTAQGRASVIFIDRTLDLTGKKNNAWDDRHSS